jgi:hypothetical protein
LQISLEKMNFEFNPGNLQPLDSLGTVYPNLRLVDVWGILTVTQGALMNSTFTKVTVTTPGDPSKRPLEGEGWKLEMNPGWTVVDGERPGDFALQKKEK